jgi:hypothetical protein
LSGAFVYNGVLGVAEGARDGGEGVLTSKSLLRNLILLLVTCACVVDIASGVRLAPLDADCAAKGSGGRREERV